MEPIEEKIVRMWVVDKYEGSKGLIFKKPQYLVALQAVDDKEITKPPMKVEVPFHRYQKMEIDSEIDVGMYSPDGRTWWFSKQTAEDIKYPKFWSSSTCTPQ